MANSEEVGKYKEVFTFQGLGNAGMANSEEVGKLTEVVIVWVMRTGKIQTGGKVQDSLRVWVMLTGKIQTGGKVQRIFPEFG